MYEKINACRSCGGSNLGEVLDLGMTPLADGLLREADLSREEPTYPLTCVVCEDCALMQLREIVEPDELYCRDYPYFSSFIDALLRHSKANVEELIAARELDAENLVIELASNDGYLLQYYAENDIPVLGIDPAAGPAEAAIARGVPTINDFFSLELAEKLRAEGKQADVIHANNVLAHVPDLNGFVRGIATLLSDDGVAVIECPHVLELIRHLEFDTIYHEHLCYFSVTALRPLFERNGLKLQDVRQLAIHGGSLRLFVGREDRESDEVRRLLEKERSRGARPARGFPELQRARRQASRRSARAVASAQGRGSLHSGLRRGGQGCDVDQLRRNRSRADRLRSRSQHPQAWSLHAWQAAGDPAGRSVDRRAAGLHAASRLELQG